jgi:hypothetical protein
MSRHPERSEGPMDLHAATNLRFPHRTARPDEKRAKARPILLFSFNPLILRCNYPLSRLDLVAIVQRLKLPFCEQSQFLIFGAKFLLFSRVILQTIDATGISCIQSKT